MELWFSEFHTPDVKHSIRVNRHLFSQKTDYQQIDIYDIFLNPIKGLQLFDETPDLFYKIGLEEKDGNSAFCF